MPNALILGASRGLGLGLAHEFVRRGWSVTGTVRKAADRAGLEQAGAAAEVADITDPASLAALHAAAAGPFDLLFVNAGISQPADLAGIDAEGIGHLFLTNAVAPVRAADALLDRLAADATVAFMSSRLGSVGLCTREYLPLYSASKAALNLLTRSFAARLGGLHPVLSLHPGWVRTDMGGANADIDIATSTKGLADVIVSHRNKPGSAFIDYSGDELSW